MFKFAIILANEIFVRDSRDVERKLYSSTPDQSMFIVEALETFINEDEDENENFSNYTNYEGVENNEVIELSVSTDLRGGRRTRNP